MGVGASGFRAALPDISTRELMFEAAALAYRDAGIDPRKDVDSFITTSEDLWEGWSITDEMVPDQLGGAGRPVCTIPGDGITALGNAVMQIESGVAKVVVLEGHSKASDVVDKGAVERLAQEPSLVRPIGAGNDAFAALEMAAFLRSTDYTLKDCDHVVEEARRRGGLNPLASFGARSKRTASQRSPAMPPPLRRADKAEHVDAAVVIVLASSAWVRQERKDATYIDGVAWSSSLPWYDGGEVAVAEYSRSSFERASAQAGLRRGIAGVDILEVDDAYSFKALQHLASLSKTDEEARSVLEGSAAAFNPSGGSLAVGNMMEASAAYRIYESVLQLRGEADRRQVKGARRALVQSWRGVPTATGGVAVLSVGA